MSKRLAYLEKLAADGKADSFGLYALAMEYRSLERWADAVGAFERLRAADPGYLAMYLMCGTTLIEAGDLAGARTWLEQGIELARARGDGKTLGELESALAPIAG